MKCKICGGEGEATIDGVCVVCLAKKWGSIVDERLEILEASGREEWY